jgi:hypothetical protein
LLAGGLDLEEVAPQHKVGWYPQILLAQMDEQRYCSNGVRNEVYQLQLVVVQETSKDVVSGHIEPTLEEGGEDDLLLVVLRRERLTGGRLPLHLCLRPQQPVLHQRLDLLLIHHGGLPDRLRGVEFGKPRLPFLEDLWIYI